MWRLFSVSYFLRPYDVQCERVSTGQVMKQRMVAVACTATVEAVQTDIQARRIVYRVETLGAILPVDGLIRSWGPKLRTVDMLTRHGDYARDRKQDVLG